MLSHGHRFHTVPHGIAACVRRDHWVGWLLFWSSSRVAGGALGAGWSEGTGSGAPVTVGAGGSAKGPARPVPSSRPMCVLTKLLQSWANLRTKVLRVVALTCAIAGNTLPWARRR